MSKILGIVQCCKECPHRRYYSAGVYECSKVNEPLPRDADIPNWCPLPDHPAHRLVAAEREMDDLLRLLQPLVGFIPQTYGDAIRAGWIKQGDCPPHEWDNRTSAANARWVLERAGFTTRVSRPDTGSVATPRPCECEGCICVQNTTPHMMLHNTYCKMARAGCSVPDAGVKHD